MKLTKLPPVRMIPALFSVLWMGCDSTSTSNGTPGHAILIDACSFLTTAEATTLLGKSVTTVKKDTTLYITNCRYEGSVDSGYILPSNFSVTVFTTAGLQNYQHSTLTVPSYFAGLKSTNGITAKESCKLRITWLQISSLAVPPSP